MSVCGRYVDGQRNEQFAKYKLPPPPESAPQPPVMDEKKEEQKP